MAAHGRQNHLNYSFGTPFRLAGLNTSMTQHEFPLVADVATDIILYPTSDELREAPDDPLLLAKARRAVDIFWHILQAALGRHGHTASLGRVDLEPDIGWLIHYR